MNHPGLTAIKAETDAIGADLAAIRAELAGSVALGLRVDEIVHRLVSLRTSLMLLFDELEAHEAREGAA